MSMIISVSESKISKLVELSKGLVAKRMATPRQVAQITGLLISMRKALGSESRLMSRNMLAWIDDTLQAQGASSRGSLSNLDVGEIYKTLPVNLEVPTCFHDNMRTRLVGWDRRSILPRSVKEELAYWVKNAQAMNGKLLIASNHFDSIVYSDASEEGYASFEVSLKNRPIRGIWAAHEKRKSSTWRELEAVRRGIKSSQDENPPGKSIKWFTDNKGVVSILKQGSINRQLQTIARDIYAICQHSSCSITPEWIPRSQNKLADTYSRFSDRDDWQLIDEQFGWIDSLWGPHEIDRFANGTNARCARFNTKFPCTGSEGVDALAQNWAGVNNWWCLPINLIAKVINCAREQKAVGTLIVPYWPSAYFWPIIRPGGKGFAKFVADHLCFQGVFTQGNDANICVFNGAPKFKTLALRINFNCSNQA